MEKKKKEIILIIILLPLMAFLLYNSLVVGPKKKKVQPPPAESPGVVVQPAGKVEAPPVPGEKEGKLPPLNEKLVQMQNQIAGQPWGRDPFIPAPTPVSSDGEATGWKDFELDGLIPGPGGGAAIINGELIEVGEYYRGYRLSTVSNSRITLEKGGQSFILTMIEE